MIVEFDKEILIIQRSKKAKYLPGKWTFIGGHVEKKENLTEAVYRELFEEVGIKGKIIVQFGKAEWERAEQKIIHTQFLFIVKANSKMVTIGNEIEDYKWVNIKNDEEFDCFNSYNKSILNKYKSIIKTSPKRKI